MYISQDRTNLEGFWFGDDFEFDPMVEDPDLVATDGTARQGCALLSGLVKWNGHDINTIRWIGGNAVLKFRQVRLDGRRGRTEIVDTGVVRSHAFHIL